MKFSLFVLIALLSVCQTTAQVDEGVLADTVIFITTSINELKSTRVNQEIYRLNFDDCNLELTVRGKDADNASWNIESFWLPDIDENQMRLAYLNETEEWAIRLVCTDNSEKIKSSSNSFTGTKFELHIRSAKKEPLISIGQGLYFAIQNCKGLDRFKEGE